jgi:hypothetical protein
MEPIEREISKDASHSVYSQSGAPSRHWRRPDDNRSGELGDRVDHKPALKVDVPTHPERGRSEISIAGRDREHELPLRGSQGGSDKLERTAADSHAGMINEQSERPKMTLQPHLSSVRPREHAPALLRRDSVGAILPTQASTESPAVDSRRFSLSGLAPAISPKSEDGKNFVSLWTEDKKGNVERWLSGNHGAEISTSPSALTSGHTREAIKATELGGHSPSACAHPCTRGRMRESMDAHASPPSHAASCQHAHESNCEICEPFYSGSRPFVRCHLYSTWLLWPTLRRAREPGRDGEHFEGVWIA